ncbi:hypothetical protein [Dactylosporangium sp. CA-233914]|uniref:hypothetical protein n=1 Tax=Dactylosporangium sp. CA-233914 TaxID=3239934 RepID=UPI003D8A1D68
MGVLTDYFAAASDERAAAVLGTSGGPYDAGLALPVVEAKGIDPVVHLGTLEELLTGVPYAEIVEGPRSGHCAGSAEGDDIVLAVTDELQRALAQAPPDGFASVAEAWARHVPYADPVFLADFLRELAALARAARERGDRLYCWICL